MTEFNFKKMLRQFLYDYWGAFHEVLEAQSIVPQRLAGSLFDDLLTQHLAFESAYSGSARGAVDELRALWAHIDRRRAEAEKADAPLTHEDIAQALQLFQQIYADLTATARQYPDALSEVVKGAPHRTPTQPLRADAAR